MTNAKNIILIETNLFFSVKLAGDVKRMGYAVDVEKNFEGVQRKAGPQTQAIILNLSAPGLDVMALIKDLKGSSATSAIPLIGFGGHKERELFRSAGALGCDLVVPNSAIASDLSAVLSQARQS